MNHFSHARARKLALLSLSLSVGLGACGGSPASQSDTVTIGLLLPFTGAASATASNFERAVLYAVDRVNAGGGVRGRRVRIVSGDTHSDLTRSRQATEALIAAGAVVVIGPESPDVATEIAPILFEHRVVFLSPLVGAANDRAVDCTHPWFRLAPSARSLGEALAKLVFAENLGSTAVLFATGAYNAALGSAASTRFTSLGGRVALTLEVDPNAQSYADAARQTIAADADSVVLATSPRTGALVVNDVDALRAKPLRWFLSPLLKTALLIENVAPDALAGALGVAPKIYDTTTAFPAAFDQRWQGDQPLEGAYFYYDAMGLLAFALEKTPPAADGSIDADAFAAAILDAAAPPGESAGWNEIETGLARLRAGDDIYYSGLTGPMLLDPCGPRRLGVTTTWQVEAGSIVNRPE
jgi:ABC-type branched-subunit amino acid transport system substrate-binding protein